MDTSFAEIPLTATFQRAAELFVETQTSDLVVVDDGRYAGILSEGDLLRALLPDFEESTATLAAISMDEAQNRFLDSGPFNRERTIGSPVLTQPVSLSPRDPLLIAATVMASEHIRRLPVIEDGHVIGMLSRAKLSWALLSRPEPSP